MSPDQSGRGKLLEFSLNGADCTTGVPHKLPEVVRLVGMPEQPPEDTAACAAEQDNRRIERCRRGGCSQDGDNRTQNGNARSTVDLVRAIQRDTN